jgi:hypothetical protein
VGIGELLLPAPHRDFAGASFQCRSPFPASPSIIPDGEISPVRLEARAFLLSLPVSRRGSSDGAHTPNGDSVCSTPRPVGVLAVFWAQSPSRSLLTEPPSPRAPSLQRRYPPSTLLRAHAPIPAPPIPFRQSPYGRCPGRLRHPRLVAGIFPLWACPSFPGVLRPLRRRFVECSLTSSSPTISAFTLAIQARLPASGSTNGFTWGCPFRRGRHSLLLWPSRLLAPLAVRHCDAAPEGFYVRAFRRFVTSSTVEYATRPTGRLPGLVLHQQEGQPFSAAHSQDKRPG